MPRADRESGPGFEALMNADCLLRQKEDEASHLATFTFVIFSIFPEFRSFSVASNECQESGSNGARKGS